MEKEIVEFFIGQGHLLSPLSLQKLVDDKFSINEPESVFYDKTRFVIEPENIKKGKKIEIINNIESVPDNISVSELTEMYNKKYDMIKNIIVSRFKTKEFVSISNLSSSVTFGDFNIIGIVRGKEKEEDRIILEMEDATGSVKIKFNKNSLDEADALNIDDVVGIGGVIKDKIIFGEKVIYPDVPLREPLKGYGRMCYISDLKLDEAPTKDLEKVFSWLSKSNIDYIFVGGKIGDIPLLEKIISEKCPNKQIFISSSDDGTPSVARKYTPENVTGLSSPCLIKINGVNVLCIDKFNLTVLKKRYIDYENKNGERGVPFKEFIISNIPDIIFYADTGKPFIENYKSITMFNSGSLLTEFVPSFINLNNREYGQIYPDNLK
ncbi:hypothetical protein CL614_06310 [archaeon]|nr:hypothetical protein [archaeon]|tara:strand:- start:97 stop:1233 length:1137 start_codon:yes stop_codon:yes gene_type:complete